MGVGDAIPVTTTLLLERLRDPLDDRAWSDFDARFRGVVLAAAARLGLSRTDAEDVTQETMLQAFRDYQAGRYDRARGRLSSWLIAIAHHRITDLQRRRRPAGDPAARSIPDEAEVAEAFDLALERVIFEEAWTRVQKTTGARDEALRAFELTAVRGVPIPEAARQTGLTVDQVYVARNRVSARLRDEVTRIDRAYRDG
ncbi:MAG: sigma-70 family RNA polymerase sigma factor, partial [Phycisphaerales bacterium]|nr:sigma-70 family RNA polymerase sigma factor [Phycisphaerales bacterium]